jgi:hypothetical protein
MPSDVAPAEQYATSWFDAAVQCGCVRWMWMKKITVDSVAYAPARARPTDATNVRAITESSIWPHLYAGSGYVSIAPPASCVLTQCKSAATQPLPWHRCDDRRARRRIPARSGCCRRSRPSEACRGSRRENLQGPTVKIAFFALSSRRACVSGTTSAWPGRHELPCPSIAGELGAPSASDGGRGCGRDVSAARRSWNSTNRVSTGGIWGAPIGWNGPVGARPEDGAQLETLAGSG